MVAGDVVVEQLASEAEVEALETAAGEPGQGEGSEGVQGDGSSTQVQSVAELVSYIETLVVEGAVRESALGSQPGLPATFALIQGQAPNLVLALASAPRPLAGPPAQVADKTTYSAFESADFRAKLAALDCRTVICSGVETDVCVLGTVMQAMDRGYRVVLVSDAVESSNPAAHRASLDHVYRRFEDQIEIGSTDEVIAHWPEATP